MHSQSPRHSRHDLVLNGKHALQWRIKPVRPNGFPRFDSNQLYTHAQAGGPSSNATFQHEIQIPLTGDIRHSLASSSDPERALGRQYSERRESHQLRRQVLDKTIGEILRVEL